MTTLETVSGIQARIFTLPNRPPFMIAADMAEVYGTTIKRLNQAVSRNPARFPEDFVFVFTEAETEHLKSQNVTSTKANRAAQRGFTHAGAYALSATLKTPIAAEVSVIVHRAFAAMEAQAIAEAQAMVAKLRSETTIKKPIRSWVVRAAADGWTFAQLWKATSYSRAKLATAVRECVALGLITDVLPGTSAQQGDLFNG